MATHGSTSQPTRPAVVCSGNAIGVVLVHSPVHIRNHSREWAPNPQILSELRWVREDSCLHSIGVGIISSLGRVVTVGPSIPIDTPHMFHNGPSI